MQHPKLPSPSTCPSWGSWLPPVLFLTGGLVALAGVATAANAAGTRAVRTDDFLNSLGANSAVSRRGERLTNTISAARFLGLRWFRVGYESGIPVADLLKLHEETGVRFSYGLMSGGTNMSRLLDGARQLAAAGALIALEGNNEPNNWGVTYEGVRGGRTNSWLPVAKLQRDLYQAVKSDPVLKDYPVWSLSENGAQTDNVGLQFLTIPAGAGTLMPDGTCYADYANCHNYLTHPSWPGLHDNQTWIAADPGPACRVDGLYGNYGRTWRRRFPGYSESDLQTLPRVTTETGVTIGGPFTEQVQALLYLSVYLDQFKRGWKHTAIYLLRDRADEAGNQTFGFYKPDYTPRLAATYLHNLTTILADTPSAEPPDSLDYSIPNPPATVHDLLLQKGDGPFELVVWNERFTGGSDEVTVKLAKPATAVTIFDPTVGTLPVRRLTDVAAITLTLSNHTVILEISGQTPERADLARLIHLAGTTHDEMERLRLLRELEARTDLDATLRADLTKLLPVVDDWADGKSRVVVDHSRAAENGYLCRFFTGRVRAAGDGPVYPPELSPGSPLRPIWAFYRGRMLIWQVIQSSPLLSVKERREKYFGEARQLLQESRAAFPENRVVRMYLGEPIPWPKTYPADPAAPAWANLLREGLEKLADVIHWWIAERQLPDGQFGGGWGDDVEMWRWWVPVSRVDVRRWELVLRSYWRSFEAHLAELVRRVGQQLGSLPVKATAREFWERCVQAGPGLARITRELVARFRTCLFGTYRCHQPEKQARKSRGQ